MKIILLQLDKYRRCETCRHFGGLDELEPEDRIGYCGHEDLADWGYGGHWTDADYVCSLWEPTD